MTELEEMNKSSWTGIYIKGVNNFLDFFSKDQILAVDIAALLESPLREMGRVQRYSM